MIGVSSVTTLIVAAAATIVSTADVNSATCLENTPSCSRPPSQTKVIASDHALLHRSIGAVAKRSVGIRDLDSPVKYEDTECDDEYVRTQGNCRGGKPWCSSGTEWDCVSESYTDAECARACDERSSCTAYDRPDDSTKAQCCLFQGNVNGVKSDDLPGNRVCMIRTNSRSSLGTNLMHSWWHRAAAFQTIAIHGKTLEELYAYLDTLDSYGTKVIGLNVCYFNGPVAMWGGLAMNDPFKVNEVFGSEAEFDRFVNKAHSKGMKVISWMNPSYWWTGSKYVKQAERDMRAVKESGGDWKTDLPADSPARWFKWTSNRRRTVRKEKPADDDAKANYPGLVLNWVWDADAGHSYRSHWADQPMVDFNSPEFQKEWEKILKYWVTDRQLDGFVYDAPDRYLGTEKGALLPQYYQAQGIPAGQFRKVITDPARKLTLEFGQFAEAYGEQDLMVDFGLSGVLQSHWDKRFEAWGDIIKGIQRKDAPKIDEAFQDYDKLICTNIAAQYNGILWQRHHNLPFGESGSRLNALARSIAVAGGYLAAIEDPGKPYNWWEEGEWWSAEPYTGTPAMLKELTAGMDACRAFDHGTTRDAFPVRAKDSWKKLYGVFRWIDGSAAAGFAIFNLEDTDATALVDIPIRFQRQSASDCATGTILQEDLSKTFTISVPAYGFKMVGIGGKPTTVGSLSETKSL